MKGAAIRVEGLGKEYMLGGAETHHETFREMLVGTFSAPLKKLRRLGGTDRAQERFWALDDISFQIGHGELIGVIGRNGAGKSTLLKILSRITEPTRGRATIRGRIASLLEVGTGFHPELTGRENVFLNGAILGMSRREVTRKFDEIVAFAEIERFLDTPVKRYSSGMYVRLAFAVAAHLEPEILLVDEVLAVGDARFQKKCVSKMGDVAGQGRTVLFVSHNMAAIRQLCQRRLWFEHGRLKGEGDAAEVIASYLQESHAARSTESLTSCHVEGKGLVLVGLRTELIDRDDGDFKDLQITLSCVLERRINPLGVGVEIRAGDDTLVGSYAPAVTGLVVDLPEGERVCTVTFPAIDRYLANGDYQLRVWIAHQRVEVLLDLPVAGSFTISELEAYGGGRAFDARSHGLVKLPLTFSAV